MRSEFGRHVSFSPWNVYWPQLNVRCVSFAHMAKRKNLLPMFAPSFRDNPLALLVVRVNLDFTSVFASSFDLSVFDLKPFGFLFQQFLGQLYQNHWRNTVRLPTTVGFWWAYNLPTYTPQAVWVISGIESCQSNYRERSVFSGSVH